MPNIVLLLLLVALGCVLLLVLVVLVFRMGSRLARIGQLLEEEAARVGEPEPLSRAEPVEGSEAQRKEFEEFLAEDESRRGLSKKEQFAAYRSWRKGRGLTWGS